MKIVIVFVVAFCSLMADACPVIKGTFNCSVKGGSSSVEMEARTVKTTNESFRYWLLESEIEAAGLPVRRMSEGIGFILIATGRCQDQFVTYTLEQFNADTNSKIGELVMAIEKLDNEDLRVTVTNTGDDDQIISCQRVSGQGR